MLPMEPGSLVMERKMLLGIKKRAAGAPTHNKVDLTDLDRPEAFRPISE